MTTPSTPRKAGPYTGNGTTTSWPFSFKVFAASDIAVTVADTVGTESTLVLDSDYTVTLNADQDTSPGGSITYALPSAYTLTVTGDLDYDQTYDIPPGGNFSPTALENALDRITMQVQQLREIASRALQAPVSSSASGYLPLPDPSALIGWDSDGESLTNFPLENIATALAFATFRPDTFTGDDVTDTFLLTSDPVIIGNIDVSVDGLTYVPNVDFTLVSQNLVFTVAPADGAQILARYGQALPPGTTADADSVSYQPSGTGAVAATVQTKLREFVSVKDFGAVGDGVTDDTAAIQNALNTVNSTSGGRIVYFPRGDYLTTNLSFSGKKGLKLQGEAGSVYSVIKVTGKITCNNVGDFSCEGLMFVGNVFDFGTRGLTGSPTANNWLFDMVDNCADWNVSRCKFYGFDNVFRPNSGASNGSYIIKIRDNYFGWNNTPIRAEGVLHWNIEGNCFSEDRVANIHITSGGEVTVANNKFENSANALSVGNIYFGTGSSLVQMNSVICGNTFHQSYGIYLNKVSKVVVGQNVVRLPKVADTLVINACEEIEVTSNQFYGYDGTYRASGINISATTGYINVTGNVVRDYATALYVSSDYAVHVSGNTLGGATYSVRVTGCTTDRRVTVSENTLLGTVRSDGNSNYWTERLNNVIAGTKFDNNDGKMDNYYLEGTWTPVPTSLTVVGTPTYTGTFVKVGKTVTCYADINSTTSTACTGGTTYFSGLPYTSTKDGAVQSVTTGGTQGGVGLATGVRAYPATWTASAAVRLTISYSV